MNTKFKTLLGAALLWSWMAPASAAIVVADYDGVGLTNTQLVGPTYAGIGIVHAGGARAAVDGGGTFDFDNEPSPNTVMYYAETAFINIAAGFDTGFSFYYSQKFAGISRAEVWSEVDGGGSLLGVISLNQNWQDGGCTSADYCNWDIGSTSFAGVARSVKLFGANYLALFDNVTFGSTTPVPLPAAVWLLASGLLGFAALRRRQDAV